MIKYTCENCGESLGTDAKPGAHEECPACRHANTVPQPAQSIVSRVGQPIRMALQMRRDKAAAAQQSRIVASTQAGAASAEQAETVAAADAAEERARAKVWASRMALERFGKPDIGGDHSRRVGVLLIVVGTITVVACLRMDVSVGSEGIANLDKLNQRLLGVVIGMGIFLAGAVTCCFSSIHRSLWNIAAYTLAQLKDHSGEEW
ncbi:MAG: hypothetical protein FJ291_26875 [Planctomycetes bacterium]|nr:hypothetical protein [Planctomycetota bacterium]